MKNLPKTTKNLAIYSIASLIVNKTILALAQYQNKDIGETTKAVINKLTAKD